MEQDEIKRNNWMAHDYRIEALGSTFAKHAEITDKQCQQSIQNFKENNPDCPVPEPMKENFNLARALSVMASEIEMLKLQL